jgi:serine/threonine protein kinase
MHELYDLILNSDIYFPDDTEISKNAKDLIKKLLNKNPYQRLGAKNGFYEIYEHDFYLNFDFNSILLKKIKPPEIPLEETGHKVYGKCSLSEEALNLFNFSNEDLEVIKSHRVFN